MSTTPNYGWPLLATNQASPEVTHNAAITDIDHAFGSLLVTAMTDADYTLNLAAVPSEASYLVYQFTGTLTANRNIIVPTNKKLYSVWNNTTTPYNLTVKTSGGSGVAVPFSASAAYVLLYCDGTNVVSVGTQSGGTVTHTAGALTLNTVILGNGSADVKAGAVLPGSASVYFDGSGNFSTPAGGGGGGGGGGVFLCQPTIVPPAPVASWTMYDSGSTGVFTDLTDAVMISSAAGNAWKFLYTAAPGVPFTLTTAFFYNMENGGTNNYPQASLFVGSSSAFRPFGVIAGGAATPAGLWVGGWNSFTSQAGNLKSPYQNYMPALLWARIQYDGTNLSFWMSTDGRNWIEQATEVCNSGILGAAPVNIGFGVSNYSSGSIPAIITLVHWNVTTP
jgi:hypothetical protein